MEYCEYCMNQLSKDVTIKLEYPVYSKSGRLLRMDRFEKIRNMKTSKFCNWKCLKHWLYNGMKNKFEV